jgi:hypothetical protein
MELIQCYLKVELPTDYWLDYDSILTSAIVGKINILASLREAYCRSYNRDE